MTILYNIETNKVIGWYDPYYKVLGKKGIVDLPAVELEVEDISQPETEEGYHTVPYYEVDLDNRKYIKRWRVEANPEPLSIVSLEDITKLLIRKVDGEQLTLEEEQVLIDYKTQQEGI